MAAADRRGRGRPQPARSARVLSSPARTPRVERSLIQLGAQLAQRAVDAAFDPREGLLEQLGDLRDGEVGAETQRDRLALLVAQSSQRALDLVAVLDGREFVGRAAVLVRYPVERPRLGLAAAGAVAQEVQRDRVQPGLLAGLAAVEALPGAQGALEGVRKEILRKRRISRSIGEKAEERLGVFLVKALEVIPPHKESPGMFV